MWKFFLPVLRPLSVICPAICRLSSDGVQFAPSPSPLGIAFPLLLFGELFIRNKFLHSLFSFKNEFTITLYAIPRSFSTVSNSLFYFLVL